jgi:hypothetical protein
MTSEESVLPLTFRNNNWRVEYPGYGKGVLGFFWQASEIPRVKAPLC